MTSDGDLGPGSASCVCNDGDIDAVIGSGVCSDAESFDLHSYFVGEQLELHEVFCEFLKRVATCAAWLRRAAAPLC